MFSAALNEFIRARWEVRRPLLPDIEPRLDAFSDGDERTLLRYYYAVMPLRDAAACPLETFADYARHAVMLRRNVDWCGTLPEALFLHHVAAPRINSENLEPCRGLFFSQLYPRVLGLSPAAAVREINYWCASKARYASSDQRTASPLTVLRSGLGRCGEESTFVVTALRSVGLPARQVYTPRWAHCDDNHAWVEVYVEDGWHFLGACEPEETLDCGWFNSAAVRALLVYSRCFSSFPDYRAEPLGSDDLLAFYNSTPLYAPVRRLDVRITGPDGRPAAAELTLSLFNMAELAPVARLRADAEGRAALHLGFGDVVATARLGPLSACALVRAHATSAELRLSGAPFAEVLNAALAGELDFACPPALPARGCRPTPAQKKVTAERLRAAAAERAGSEAAFFARAREAADGPEAEKLLLAARGNTEEIARFLRADGSALRLRLLKTLSAKDLLDAKADLLEHHLQAAAVFADRVRTGFEDSAPVWGRLPDDLFDACILCPRMDFEELTRWRRPLAEAFTEAEKAAFYADPRALTDWIGAHLRHTPAEEYSTLLTPPDACLRFGQASPASQRVFFAAACRALGIPARLNPHTRLAEYWEDGVFLPAWPEAVAGERALLTLHADAPADMAYYVTWSLARLQDGDYATLEYADAAFGADGLLTLPLEAGDYRLIVTARMPNGSQKLTAEHFTLEPAADLRRELHLQHAAPGDCLLNAELPAVTLFAPDGAPLQLPAGLAGQKALLLFLEEGAEPTEHVLNELLARRARGELPYRVLPVAADPAAAENATLARALRELGVPLYTADFAAQLEPLARALFVDHEKLPLLAAVGANGRGLYACSGYRVGSVDLAEKLLALTL